MLAVTDMTCDVTCLPDIQLMVFALSHIGSLSTRTPWVSLHCGTGSVQAACQQPAQPKSGAEFLGSSSQVGQCPAPAEGFASTQGHMNANPDELYVR